MRSRSRQEKKKAVPPLNARLLDSPVRLGILCIAVLMISVCGGILVGHLFGSPDGMGKIAELRANTVAEGFVRYDPDSLDRKNPPAEAEESPFAYNNYPPEAATEQEILPALKPPAKDAPAWKRYAALAPPVNGSPMIAIVIDDMGLSESRVEEVADLPALLTLSFLPYAPSLQKKADLARRLGHEVMLHMPMEPMSSHIDPGPNALLTELSDDELRRRTIENLDSFTGYVGVNNHMGSKFTADEHAMTVFMDVMAKRGLLFLDSKTIAASDGYKLAVERGMPAVKRDIFIDNTISKQAIMEQLEKVKLAAERKGVVIAIGHPHPLTVEALKTWLPEMKKQGFRFVPVSVVTALTFNG